MTRTKRHAYCGNKWSCFKNSWHSKLRYAIAPESWPHQSQSADPLSQGGPSAPDAGVVKDQGVARLDRRMLVKNSLLELGQNPFEGWDQDGGVLQVLIEPARQVLEVLL